MKLLTRELEKRFAQIGSQENVEDPIVIAKFFDPTGSGTWLVTALPNALSARASWWVVTASDASRCA